MNRPMAAAAEVVLWALAPVGLWVVTHPSGAASNVLVAAGAGVLCGVAVTAVRRALSARWGSPIDWARWSTDVPDATRAARRAFATIAGSLPPPTYVVDVDEDTERLVVHSIVQGSSTAEDALSA